MTDAMISTIDASGRFVLPRRARALLGLEPGQRLRVDVHDGRVELVPLPIEAELVEHLGGVLVITPCEDVGEMTPDDVCEAIADTRK